MKHQIRIQTRPPRCDRPSHSVGCYVETYTRPTKPFGRSLRSDQPSHSVSHYVATDPRTSRSLRSDRPNLSFGRYVLTDPARTRSLSSDRTVSNIDQRVRPKFVHSRLFLNASSHVPQLYHFSHHSDQSYRWNSTIKTARTCFFEKKIVTNVSCRNTAQRGLKRD